MASTTPGGPPLGPSTPHDDTGPNMIAAAFTTWAIAFIFVLLRFWTRTRIVPVLGLTDWFIALSVVSSGGMCVAQVFQCAHGMGKHIYNVDLSVDGPPMMEAWWFSLLFYVLTLFFTKVSIVLLYLNIFTFDWVRKTSYAVLVIVVVSNIWGISITVTYCIPLAATWDPTVIASFCQPQDAWWANTALVIATDFLIFFLPIPVVLPLKLPRRQKFILMGIFTIGFFVCVISLIRLASLIQIKSSTDPDFTYNGTTLFYWTVIEVHTAIAIACIMTLKPLVFKFFPSLLTPRNSDSDASGDVNTGPPRTIGSTPFRPGDIERGLSQGGVTRKDASVDLNGVVRRDVDVEKLAAGVVDEKGSVGPSEKSTMQAPEEVVEAVVGGRSPWVVRRDVRLDSAEELGREMTARSIG